MQVKEEDVKVKGSGNENGGIIEIITTSTRKPVLTASLKLEGESDGQDYAAPNILQRVLSLLSNVRPGTDLTRFQASYIYIYTHTK